MIGVELLVSLISKIFLMVDGRFDKTITVFAIVMASEMLCVTMIVVLFSFFIILYTSSETISLDWASSAENGSSNRIISGFMASVLISATV